MLFFFFHSPSLFHSSQFVVMINDVWLLNDRPMMLLVTNVLSLYFFMLLMDINILQFCFVLFLIACGIAVCILASCVFVEICFGIFS